MGVVNGQPVDAPTTNAAFINKNQDDQMPGKLDFTNSDVVSGVSIFNIQKNINSAASFVGYSVNASVSVLPSWATNFRGSSSDNLFLRVGSIDTAFASTSGAGGHVHDGTAGNGPQITTSGIILLGAKGSLLTTNGTINQVLPVGSNAYVLTADSTQANGIGWAPSTGGIVKVDLFDPVSTALPSGTSAVIDGVTLTDGLVVLFTNLSTGNNEAYQVSGVGVALAWTPQTIFGGTVNPSTGDSTRIVSGLSFAEQLSVFNGTNWTVNDTVRFFTGADYWEMSSLKTSTLANNTTGDVFTVGATGSENIIVDYSLVRGSGKETGSIVICSDGVNVEVTGGVGYISSIGVDLFGDISGPNLRLRFTTDNSGPSATMKYFIRRWPDAAGGPGGPPSYTVSSPSLSAAGVSEDIQFNSSGLLAGDSSFQWDSSNKILRFNGVELVGMQSATIVDNSPSSLAFSYDATLYPFAIVEYSIKRNNSYQVGQLMVTTDAVTASVTNISDDTIPAGVTFLGAVSGSNVQVNYTSTSTGFNGTMKFSIKRWS